MREFNPSRQAKKFLRKLPPKQKNQILRKIEALCENPLPHDMKHLKGGKNDYRADQGEYRIIYRFDDECVYVMVIDRRNDGTVYKKYARLLEVMITIFGS